MWLVFAVISLLCYASSDLIGKKCADVGNALAPVKLLASTNAVSIIAGMVIYALGIGESGQAPWQLIANHPMILLNVLCYGMHWLFFLLSMRYIGLSMDEAVQGTFGVFYFVGLLLVHLFSGKLSYVREMLHPLRLVPIAFVLVFTVLLPNVEVIAQRRFGNSLVEAKAERRNIIIGLLLLLVATAFDSLDSVLATVILENDRIGTVDYMEASYFAQILPCVLFLTFIMVKTKKCFIPFMNCGKYSLVYTLTALLSSAFYLLSSSYNAVRTGILFIAYPIVPIFGAKMILKEKYTWRQNLCIWTITACAILFCVADATVSR